MRFLKCLFLLVFPSISLGQTINISAAVSLREAMLDVGHAFHSLGSGDVNFTFGSSGQLAAQIMQGAPVDGFISAANKQVDDLAAAGRVDRSTVRVIAANDLVLIVPGGATSNITSFESLKDPSLQQLVIGEPHTVPAGQYAEQVLASLGLSEILRPKILYGASVRQVLSYVESGEVAAGIVYRTDALESREKVRQVALAEANTHEPIVYPAVVVQGTSKRGAVLKFFDLLTQPAGKAALAARGFTVENLPPASQPTSGR